MRTAFPAVADRASGRAVPVHRARYRRQGHLLALGAAAGTAAEISGRSDRATIGVGSPVLEMRNWAMRTTTRAAPKPGHTRSGEHGRTSSPESGTSTSSCGNQTRCSPHRGWIPYGTTDQGKRPLSIGPSTSRGRRQRRDDYEHSGSRSVDIVYDVDGPRPTAHGRSPLFMIGQPKDASGFRILPETAEFGRPPRLAARAFHASGIRLRSPGSVLPPHTRSQRRVLVPRAGKPR